MTMQNQKTSTEQTNRKLTDKELEGVAGGLNPQPLPPRIGPEFRARF
jgi:hypothetical protein